jgi:ABC-2 type transport system ATP-binding protein
MHDPEVLILDEPTSGLDPNQIKEIRALIKTLGEEKTVIFSSHILQEVQALCDRVLIIDHGKLVADDSIDHLQHMIKKDSIIQMEFSQPVDAAVFKAVSGVKEVNSKAGNALEIICSTENDLRPALFNTAVQHKYIILAMTEKKNTMEEVFQQLTRTKV